MDNILLFLSINIYNNSESTIANEDYNDYYVNTDSIIDASAVEINNIDEYYPESLISSLQKVSIHHMIQPSSKKSYQQQNL